MKTFDTSPLTILKLHPSNVFSELQYNHVLNHTEYCFFRKDFLLF
jgi:hypothetical protein